MIKKITMIFTFTFIFIINFSIVNASSIPPLVEKSDLGFESTYNFEYQNSKLVNYQKIEENNENKYVINYHTFTNSSCTGTTPTKFKCVYKDKYNNPLIKSIEVYVKKQDNSEYLYKKQTYSYYSTSPTRLSSEKVWVYSDKNSLDTYQEYTFHNNKTNSWKTYKVNNYYSNGKVKLNESYTYNTSRIPKTYNMTSYYFDGKKKEVLKSKSFYNYSSEKSSTYYKYKSDGKTLELKKTSTFNKDGSPKKLVTIDYNSKGIPKSNKDGNAYKYTTTYKPKTFKSYPVSKATIQKYSSKGKLDTSKKTKVKTINKAYFNQYNFDVKRDSDVGKDSINIYLSGMDNLNGAKTIENGFSDANMIVTYNLKTSKILLTSIPRDYYVPLACKNGAMDKLSHSGKYGETCTVNTIENLFGIDIDYYVRVKFNGFINIVNELDKIDVYTPIKFTTTGGAYTFKKGYNNLEGTKALAFVRERKKLPHMDISRTENQQRAMEAIFKKVKTLPSLKIEPIKILSILNNVKDTNMSYNDLKVIAKIFLENKNKIKIEKTLVTGKSGSSKTTYTSPKKTQWISIPNKTSVQKASAKIYSIYHEK